MRAAINTEIITRRSGRNVVNLNKMFSLRSFQIKILEDRSLQLQKDHIEKRKKILNNIFEESSNGENGMSNVIDQVLKSLGISKFAKNLNKTAKVKTKKIIPTKIKSKVKKDSNIKSKIFEKPAKFTKNLKRATIVKGKRMIPRQLRPKFPSLKIKSPPALKGLSKIAPNVGKKIPVLNVLFTGLDAASRLSQGQTKTQAIAGAGAGLGGSLAGGAIGQALIPIPVVGFAVGSILGGFLASKLSDKVTGVDQPQIVDKKTSKISRNIVELEKRGKPIKNKRGRIIGYEKVDESIKNKTSTKISETNKDILKKQVNMNDITDMNTKNFTNNNIINVTSSMTRNDKFKKSNIANVKFNKSGQTFIVQNEPDTVVKSVPGINNSNSGGGSIIVSESSYDAAIAIAKLEAARTV